MHLLENIPSSSQQHVTETRDQQKTDSQESSQDHSSKYVETLKDETWFRSQCSFSWQKIPSLLRICIKWSSFILCLPFSEAARLLNKRKVRQILQTMRRQRPRKQEKQQSGQKLGQSSLSLLLQIYYQRDSEGMLCCLLQPTESWQMLLAMGELPEWRILRRTPIPIQLIRWLDQRE